MTSKRMLRVNELIKRVIGDLLERDVLGPFDALLTVTRAETAPDLRQSTVYVSVFGSDAQQQDALRRLQKRRALVQHELARRTELKYTPVLCFRLDRTMADADRVLAILSDLDLADGPDPESVSTPLDEPSTASGPESETTG